MLRIEKNRRLLLRSYYNGQWYERVSSWALIFLTFKNEGRTADQKPDTHVDIRAQRLLLEDDYLETIT